MPDSIRRPGGPGRGGFLRWFESAEERLLRDSAFYLIETSDGGRLKRPLHSFPVVNASERDEGRDVIGFVPANARDNIYLFTAGGWNSLLSFLPSIAKRLIVPFRIEPGPEERVHLRAVDLGGGIYLSAAPRGDTAGLVCLDREIPAGWESFRLRPITPAIDSRALRMTLRAVVATVAALGSGGPAAGGRRLAGLSYEGLSLCRDYLNADDVLTITSRVEADRLPTGRLFAHDGQDFWADTAVPGLKAWLKAGRPPGPNVRRIDPSLDHLDIERFDDRYESLSHEVNCRLRAGVAPRAGACILATARNEGPYLVDWVAYHREIGFERIFIYSNDNDDGSDAILRRLAELDRIVWIDNVIAKGRRPQNKAYAHALSVLPEILDYEWAAIIDLDEFVWFDAAKFRDIGDFLGFQGARGSDVVRLTWSVITSNGQEAYRREPIFDRFPWRLSRNDVHTKCIVKPRLSCFSTPHYPILVDAGAARQTDASGAPFQAAGQRAFSSRPLSEPACINHYFCKSRDEFATKFSRNRGDHYLVKGEEIVAIPEEIGAFFAAQFSDPDVVPAGSPRDCARGFDAARAQLMADPAIEAAMKVTEAWHRARAMLVRGRPAP